MVAWWLYRYTLKYRNRDKRLRHGGLRLAGAEDFLKEKIALFHPRVAVLLSAV